MSGEEEWRPIPGCSDYSVSSLGRIVSHKGKTSRILRCGSIYKGYLGATLMSDEGRRVSTRVHQVVAVAFFGPRPEGHEVRHLDGNPSNNRVENLRYGTRSENERDKLRHGTHNLASRTHCPAGHAYDENNTRMRPTGGRDCRACSNIRRKARHQREREQRAA